MPDTEKETFGRLAFRDEGTVWNCYFTRADSMDGAILLGSIKMAFVDGNPERKQAFMDLMQECFADQIEELSGVRPTFLPPRVGPQHERGGPA